MPPTRLTANDVRRLAESLDGLRDTPVRVVLRNGTLRALPATQRPRAGDRELFEAETPNAAPARPRLTALRLDPKVAHPATGELVDDVFQLFDAIFWTEPAVSKFVLPYYMRHYHPEDVHRLWLAFVGQKDDGTPDPDSQVLAFGHLPTSEPEVIEDPDDPGGTGEGGRDDDGGDTMALIVAEPAAPADAADGPPGAPGAAAGAGARRHRVVTARRFLAERARRGRAP